jgi:pimeloyl-ACP methyl ester carboxylesterase
VTGLALALLAALADGGVDPVEALTPSAALVSATSAREYVDQLLEDGRHIRFGTDGKGPVHVWRPSSYKPPGASTVVYLHGFYSNADSAFFEHRLATQFRDSGRNAVFIVPEVPSWRTDPIYWDDLEALLKLVFERTKLKRPDGPLMVIAHSGAYRNTIEWLGHPQLKQVVLLDALYGGEKDFQTWLETTMVPGKQLVLVGFETSQRTDWFLRMHPNAVKLDDVPYLYDKVPKLNAQVIYFSSDRFDHMALVTDGRVLPYLLHALP